MSGRTLAVVCATAAFALLVQFRPVRDVDMFWQVATGEEMLATGRLVTTDPFTTTHAGEPVPTVYWLSQLGYAAFLRVGSWTLLHRIDAWAFAAAFGLVAWRAARPVPAFPTALALGLAALVALPSHGLRPQTFAVVGFALLVVLERSTLTARVKVVVTLLLVVLWQNLHPSGATAVLYLGVRAAGELAGALLPPLSTMERGGKTGSRPPVKSSPCSSRRASPACAPRTASASSPSCARTRTSPRAWGSRSGCRRGTGRRGRRVAPSGSPRG